MTEVHCLKRYYSGKDRPTILYCGDDDLDRAAGYLASIIFHNGYNFDYIPSYSSFPANLELDGYDLIILSDYPARNFTVPHMMKIKSYAAKGGSILMIGGWESFTGLMKEYYDTPVADLLPVKLESEDDRHNLPQGCVVVPKSDCAEHFRSLDWNTPPLIGGYNQFCPLPRSAIQLIGKRLVIGRAPDLQISIRPEEIPLLVSSSYQKGFAAALAFDLAPHWIGGMIDWGKLRQRIDFNQGFIEVGDQYYSFVSKLLAFSISKGE